jgi:hypothetical protein
MRYFAIVPNTMKYSVQQPLMLVRITDAHDYERYDKYEDMWVGDGSLTRFFNGGDNDAQEITVQQADAAVKQFKERVANMLPEQKAKAIQRRAEIQAALDKLRPVENQPEATPEVAPEVEPEEAPVEEPEKEEEVPATEEEEPEKEEKPKKKPVKATVVKK